MTYERPYPFILTARLDEHSFAIFDDLRRQYFALERNWVPAHITLFHQLPGEQAQSLVSTIQSICSRTPVLTLWFPKARFLGRGVAIEVECKGLLDLRKRFVTEWGPWLVPQDRGGYKPHITIQNKVSASQARLFFENMSSPWRLFFWLRR